MLVFRKEKMKQRIEREGRLYLWDKEVEEIAENMDGCGVTYYNWQAVVHDRAVCYGAGKDGTGHYVAACDCEVV